MQQRLHALGPISEQELLHLCNTFASTSGNVCE